MKVRSMSRDIIMKHLWVLLIVPFILGAAPIKSTTFVSDTTIKAGEVNTNFDDLYGYTQTGVDTLRAGAVDAITEVDSSLRSGSDQTLITGTKGTSGNCAEWNADGDLVGASAACGTGSGDAWSDAVDSDILPTGADNTYDLGSAGASFKDIFWDGTATGNVTGDLTGNADTVTTVGAVTNVKVCQGDGTSVECDLTQDGAGACAAGSVCTGGHTHAAASPAFNWRFEPQTAKLPSSNPMAIDAGQGRWKGLFDDTTDECAQWSTSLKPYQAGGLNVDIGYTLETTSTNDTVEFEVYVMAVTDADAQDVDTDSFDSVNNVSSGSVSTTAGRLDILTAALSNMDSGAEGDMLIVKICRDADDTDDTDDDVELRFVNVRE